MGVGKGWNSKNRVHTQFFTLTNPGSGVLSNDGTKPSSLPPVLSLLFLYYSKRKLSLCQEIDTDVSVLTEGVYPPTNALVGGFTFLPKNTII